MDNHADGEVLPSTTLLLCVHYPSVDGWSQWPGLNRQTLFSVFSVPNPWN